MSNDETTNNPFSQNETDTLTGMALMHAMSIAYQGLIDVKKTTGQECPVSLNMMIVAEPGQSKTQVYSVALKAITNEALI